MATQTVNRILRRYGNDPTDIIAILQDVQQAYRYLPRDVMETLSARLDIPLSRIYHLATFFRAFSLEPRGKHELQVCLGTACHVRGAPRILEALERRLKIKAGQTTSDLEITLETVNCVGACALGPVVVVDGNARGKLNPQRAERLLEPILPEAAPKRSKAKRPPAKAKRSGAPGKKKAPARKAKKKSTVGKAASSAAARPARAGKKVVAGKRAGKRTAKKAKR